MAKKKKAAKAVKSARGRAVPRATRSSKSRVSKVAAKSRARKRAPVQQELIKGVRYVDLDRLCRSIGDTRDEINRFKGEDADLGLKAIKAMRVHGVTTYHRAGITLMLVPGDEKLRVLKDRAGKASSGEGAAEPDEPTDEQNNGDDAPDEPASEAVN